jgi:hypothetical protein
MRGISHLPRAAGPVLLAVIIFAAPHCPASRPYPLQVPPPAKNAGHLVATRSHTFKVHLPLADAFTLFEPVGEKNWAEGFDPVFATPESSTLGDDSIFTVEASHGGVKHQTIWLITRYDRAAALVEYRAVYPGVRVARITVRCRASAESETTVEVTYRYTGLSADGDEYIAGMTEGKFGEFIETWNSAIGAYLARGTPAVP